MLFGLSHNGELVDAEDSGVDEVEKNENCAVFSLCECLFVLGEELLKELSMSSFEVGEMVLI